MTKIACLCLPRTKLSSFEMIKCLIGLSEVHRSFASASCVRSSEMRIGIDWVHGPDNADSVIQGSQVCDCLDKEDLPLMEMKK
jgi:hypothetical protein